MDADDRVLRLVLKRSGTHSAGVSWIVACMVGCGKRSDEYDYERCVYDCHFDSNVDICVDCI